LANTWVVFRVEMVGPFEPNLAELYYLYGTALIGLAKKGSVDCLSASMQRKVREKSGEDVDEEEEATEASASAASFHPLRLHSQATVLLQM